MKGSSRKVKLGGKEFEFKALPGIPDYLTAEDLKERLALIELEAKQLELVSKFCRDPKRLSANIRRLVQLSEYWNQLNEKGTTQIRELGCIPATNDKKAGDFKTLQNP